MNRSDQYAMVTAITLTSYLAASLTGALMHGDPRVVVQIGIGIMALGLAVTIVMQICDRRK